MNAWRPVRPINVWVKVVLLRVGRRVAMRCLEGSLRCGTVLHKRRVFRGLRRQGTWPNVWESCHVYDVHSRRRDVYDVHLTATRRTQLQSPTEEYKRGGASKRGGEMEGGTETNKAEEERETPGKMKDIHPHSRLEPMHCTRACPSLNVQGRTRNMYTIFTLIG